MLFGCYFSLFPSLDDSFCLSFSQEGIFHPSSPFPHIFHIESLAVRIIGAWDFGKTNDSMSDFENEIRENNLVHRKWLDDYPPLIWIQV